MYMWLAGNLCPQMIPSLQFKVEASQQFILYLSDFSCFALSFNIFLYMGNKGIGDLILMVVTLYMSITLFSGWNLLYIPSWNFLTKALILVRIVLGWVHSQPWTACTSWCAEPARGAGEGWRKTQCFWRSPCPPHPPGLTELVPREGLSRNQSRAEWTFDLFSHAWARLYLKKRALWDQLK